MMAALGDTKGTTQVSKDTDQKFAIYTDHINNFLERDKTKMPAVHGVQRAAEVIESAPLSGAVSPPLSGAYRFCWA